MLDIDTRISGYLREAGLDTKAPTVVPLTGDASDRRYFRVLLPGQASQVLAVHPGPLDFQRLPFVNVAELLAAMPVPAPAVIGCSDALGIMALQDLGDVTLYARLPDLSAAERSAHYREAVTLIDTLQRRGAELASSRYVPYTLAFDVEKLTYELNFFAEHFLGAHRGISLSVPERDALSAAFDGLVTQLAAEPRVLCHRDYHSRNLMLHGGRLHVIDFQDARLGPDTYDLASLLRDSYVDLTEDEVDDLIGHFLRLRAARPGVGAAEDAAGFRARFDAMAVQRNLKALGTFGFQATSRHNTTYLKYVPRTLAYVRANLLRYARFVGLREILGLSLPELR